MMIRFLFFLTIAAAGTLPAAEFNADSAFAYLLEQVAFGPRNPNSEGHVKCGVYLENKLRDYCDEVEVQPFYAMGYNENLRLRNIIGRFNPDAMPRRIIAAHWDTRPRAERDKDRPDDPILGAHDGASGVAILLELARVFSQERPGIGIDIVFFDGEDYGHEGDLSKYFLGARHFASRMEPGVYVEGILLDMVGDKYLTIDREQYSTMYAKRLQDELWSIAFAMGYDGFRDQQGLAIQDDHIILIKAGVPMVNIIDFQYPDVDNSYWHTHNDLPENCSPESLDQVGNVVLEYLRTR